MIRKEKAAHRQGKKRKENTRKAETLGKTWSSGLGSGERLPTSRPGPRFFLCRSTSGINQPTASVIQMEHSDKYLESFMVPNEYQCSFLENEQLCCTKSCQFFSSGPLYTTEYHFHQ